MLPLQNGLLACSLGEAKLPSLGSCSPLGGQFASLADSLSGISLFHLSSSTIYLTGSSYLTPFLILVPLFVHPKKQTTQPSTEESIQHAINDLTELKQALVLSQWKRIQYNIPFRQALRLVGIAYIPFLLVVTFVRTRVLVGIVGTIALSWKSWWFQEIVNVLWYSAFVRYGLARMWSLASGAPLPPGLTHARKDDDLIFITKENNTTDMKILFTILGRLRDQIGLAVLLTKNLRKPTMVDGIRLDRRSVTIRTTFLVFCWSSASVSS